MALSNWDMLSFDHLGGPSNGSYISSEKYNFEIYKNWLYIKLNQEKDLFTFYEGSMEIGGCNIVACRGPQNSIFVLVTSIVSNDRLYFGGIGAYGFDDPTERLCKTANVDSSKYHDIICSTRYNESKESFFEIRCYDIDIYKDIDQYDPEKHVHVFNVPYDESLESQWVGIVPETLEEFFKWLESLEDHKYEKSFFQWIEKCKKSDAVRTNQGDQYFADELGINSQSTKVGDKVHQPFIMQIIKSKSDQRTI